MTSRIAASDATGALVDLLDQRMQRWARTTPARALSGAPAFREPGDVIVRHLDEHRRSLAIACEAGDGVERMAGRTLAWLRGHNQFVEVDEPTLRDVYRDGSQATARLLVETRSADALAAGLRDVLQTHVGRLRELVRRWLGDAPRAVVASTYSPVLQLQALGDPRPCPPVLDLGSGDGALVAHLRADGIDTVGLDRDPGHAGAIQGDWLHADYGVDRWGTVLAHLSFSLHFLHHELARSARIRDYARTYRRILASLRPGGTFAYVPAVPPIEHALDPDRYLVTRHPVPFALADAVHVQRIA